MKVVDVVVYNGSRYAHLHGDGFYYVWQVHDPHGVVSIMSIGPVPGQTVALEKSDLVVVGSVGKVLNEYELLTIMASRSIPDELADLFRKWIGERPAE